MSSFHYKGFVIFIHFAHMHSEDVHVNAGAQRGQRRPLELDLQAAMRWPGWVLDTKSGSRGRAVYAHNC